MLTMALLTMAPLTMGVLLTMAGHGLRLRQQAPARYNAEDGLLGGRADETAALRGDN